MLGTWPTGQWPWPHSMLQLWVGSNEPCQPSQEGITWGYHDAAYALDSGMCPQTGYHQQHKVPGAAPMPQTISMFLFSGVEMPRNCRAKKQVTTLVSSCPMWFPRPFDHTKNSFLYFFFKGGLWITSAPDYEAWWLELNSQSAGTQRCPAFFCVSILFLQLDS